MRREFAQAPPRAGGFPRKESRQGNAEYKTVHGSTKLGTLKKRSGAISLNEAREALRNHNK